MDQLPITIRRSFFGYVIILFWGLLLLAALIGAVYIGGMSGTINRQTFDAAGLAALFIFAGVVIALYVYHLSYITLTAQGIESNNFGSLFFNTDSMTEWQKVQAVDVIKPGFFAEIFNYGTLLIQSAQTTQRLRLTFTPNVEHWQQYIQDKAGSTPQIVHNV